MMSLPYAFHPILRLSIGFLFLAAVGCASTPKKTASTPPTSATAGTTTIVAIAPPASSGCSLPQFLGLPNIASGVGGALQRIGSRLLQGLDLTGRFPGLQPQPPLLSLTDPANLEPGAPPAVQAAAEIKAEEDAAPQKIMAIRYLATLGCGGCYEKVEQALLEALSDCTEAVRYEAVKALQCRPDSCCKFCSSPSCCSPSVRKKLKELTTCEKEPSERVQRAARLALACCESKPLKTDDIPREGPTAAPALDENAPGLEGQVAANGEPRQSALFSGIQLVSFEAPLANRATDDMLLASVNDEPIYESQLLPLVEARLKTEPATARNDVSLRKKFLAIELARVIDWKLLEQQARNERGPESILARTQLSAPEIQVWFNRKLQVEQTVSPQELLAYYQVHLHRYQLPTRVRWERITVFVDRCGTLELAASIATYLRTRTLGGQIAPPEGFVQSMIAVDTNGWRDLNQIESKAIRNGLTSLQNGQTSRTIEEDGQLILLRMLERQEDRFIPLPLAADRIVSEILSERRTASELRFLSQVRAQSKIWTVFDTNQPTTATPQVAATAPRQSFATILVKNDRENLDVAVGQATHQVLPSMNTAIPPLAPQPASP